MQEKETLILGFLNKCCDLSLNDISSLNLQIIPRKPLLNEKKI